MSLIREVLLELFAMFWADAGLCLGALGVVAVVGLGVHLGGLPAAWALGALVLGTVATLLLSVWAARAKARARR